MDGKRVILGVLLFLNISVCAWANPTSFAPQITLGVMIALAYEALLLSCLFGLVNFRFLALSIVWLSITYLTFLAFRTVFGSLYKITDSFYSVFVGEITVILAEAKIIQWLSRLPILDFNDLNRPLRFIKALGYSTVINIGSILAGMNLNLPLQ
jgi:hypothetical protein